MPERKRPIVAIVAAHERRKTVDDILNTTSLIKETTEEVRFQLFEPTLLGNAAFFNSPVDTWYMITIILERSISPEYPNFTIISKQSHWVSDSLYLKISQRRRRGKWKLVNSILKPFTCSTSPRRISIISEPNETNKTTE